MITGLIAGALIVLGTASYVATQKQSKTALIPAGFGVLILGTEVTAVLVPSLAGVMGVAAMSIAALGSLATLRSIPGALQAVSGVVNNRAAVLSKAAMSVLCAGVVFQKLL